MASHNCEEGEEARNENANSWNDWEKNRVSHHVRTTLVYNVTNCILYCTLSIATLASLVALLTNFAISPRVLLSFVPDPPFSVLRARPCSCLTSAQQDQAHSFKESVGLDTDSSITMYKLNYVWFHVGVQNYYFLPTVWTG